MDVFPVLQRCKKAFFDHHQLESLSRVNFADDQTQPPCFLRAAESTALPLSSEPPGVTYKPGERACEVGLRSRNTASGVGAT